MTIYKRENVHDLLKNISAHFGSLPKSQQKAGDYIYHNIRDIAFITLDALAYKIGVSSTSIIRLTRRLGYRGYSEMQQSIQDSLVGKNTLPDRFIDAAGNINKNEILKKAIQNDIDNINSTFNNISETQLSKTVRMILSSPKVYILGLRSSFSLAVYFASLLGQIKDNVKLIQGTGLLFPEEIISAKKGELCIVFLFPRYAKMSIDIIAYLKKIGLKILAISSQSNPAIDFYADSILHCSVQGISFKSSLVAPMCLINYLVAAVAMENFEDSKNTVERLEEILKTGFYHGL